MVGSSKHNSTIVHVRMLLQRSESTQNLVCLHFKICFPINICSLNLSSFFLFSVFYFFHLRMLNYFLLFKTYLKSYQFPWTWNNRLFVLSNDKSPLLSQWLINCKKVFTPSEGESESDTASKGYKCFFHFTFRPGKSEFPWKMGFTPMKSLLLSLSRFLGVYTDLS